MESMITYSSWSVISSLGMWTLLTVSPVLGNDNPHCWDYSDDASQSPRPLSCEGQNGNITVTGVVSKCGINDACVESGRICNHTDCPQTTQYISNRCDYNVTCSVYDYINQTYEDHISADCNMTTHTIQHLCVMYMCIAVTSGITITKRSEDDYFTGLTCPVGWVINITQAKVGDDKGWQQCALNMIDHKPDYYQEILATCTGRQSCEDLRVDTQGEIWCPGSTFYADDITYIQVLYNCDPAQTPPTTTPVTTPSAAPSSIATNLTTTGLPSNTDTMAMTITQTGINTISPVSHTNGNTALMIALPIVLVLLLIAVVITVVAIYHRYRQKKSAAQDAELKMQKLRNTRQNQNLQLDTGLYANNDQLFTNSGEEFNYAATPNPVTGIPARVAPVPTNPDNMYSMVQKPKPAGKTPDMDMLENTMYDTDDVTDGKGITPQRQSEGHYSLQGYRGSDRTHPSPSSPVIYDSPTPHQDTVYGNSDIVKSAAQHNTTASRQSLGTDIEVAENLVYEGTDHRGNQADSPQEKSAPYVDMESPAPQQQQALSYFDQDNSVYMDMDTPEDSTTY